MLVDVGFIWGGEKHSTTSAFNELMVSRDGGNTWRVLAAP